MTPAETEQKIDGPTTNKYRSNIILFISLFMMTGYYGQNMLPSMPCCYRLRSVWSVCTSSASNILLFRLKCNFQCLFLFNNCISLCSDQHKRNYVPQQLPFPFILDVPMRILVASNSRELSACLYRKKINSNITASDTLFDDPFQSFQLFFFLIFWYVKKGRDSFNNSLIISSYN